MQCGAISLRQTSTFSTTSYCSNYSIVMELPLYLGHPVATVTHYCFTSEPISAHHVKHIDCSQMDTAVIICLYVICIITVLTLTLFNSWSWKLEIQRLQFPSVFVLHLQCLHAVLSQPAFSATIIKAHLM